MNQENNQHNKNSRQSHQISQNSDFKVITEQYSQRQSYQINKNKHTKNQSIGGGALNASLQGSIGYSSGLNNSLNKQIDDQKQKKKSYLNKNISQNDQLKQSLLSEKEKQRLLKQRDQNKNQNTKKKFIQKQFYPSLILIVIGIIIFILSFIIHHALQSKAIDMVILSSDNQNLWAHFPGDSKVQIDRNWTFFNITNAQQMLFYNQRPKFSQISGFKIIQLQDYLNITYIDDGDRVQMIDWLHFIQQPQTRNLDQKVKILNVGGLAYWYNLKITRPTVILQQGLALLFNNLELAVIQNIYAQAIKTLYLPDYETTYANILSIAGLSDSQAIQLWEDPKFGLKDQNNLKYWIQAIPSMQELQNQQYNDIAIYLTNYFILKDSEISTILTKFKVYKQSINQLIVENNYCSQTQACTGHYLAYRQIANSYVTLNTPKGTSILPTQTICQSNITCSGFYPQISAFYKNIYLKRNPNANKSLIFNQNLTKRWFNYNQSIIPSLNYSIAEDCLLHIGNLDALWENGTKSDQKINHNSQIPSKYIENIKNRFGLPTQQHAVVFWSWIKYLAYQFVLQNQQNQFLGIANLFSKGIYQSFSYLEGKLQDFLLNQLILVEVTNHNVGDCISFVQNSMQLKQQSKAEQICNLYGQKISKQFISDMTSVCKNRFSSNWKKLKNTFSLTSTNLYSLCDSESKSDQFGSIYSKQKILLKEFYKCKKQYCTDFELAAMQWSSSKITLNPPPQLKLQKSFSFYDWNQKSDKFQYGFYINKYPNQTFPILDIIQAYKLLNFDNWFSAPIVLKTYIDEKTDERFKKYMKYVAIVSGLNGLTTQRTARELIFGYNDQILQDIKNMYPPFGGDPSTPSLVAFNDPNITKEQAVMKLQWSTGKNNNSLIGQYRKINELQYLTIPKDSFNGNQTRTDLISPWQGQDYVYGTSAKQFSPNQFDNGNISLYVPNIQRYGSGTAQSTFDYQRFGFDLKIGYLGESIYESTQQSDINKKYYQTFHAIFNETSVVGFPLFVTKNHFMNCTQNWTKLVQIYNQNQTIKYQNASQWDDSFVIIQPYSGVSFQSTIYLQSNYYHLPDQLMSFYQESMLPVFSLCRSGNITQQAANNLFSPLKTGLSVIKWTKIIGIFLICVSLIYFGVIYFKKSKKNQQNYSRIKQNSSVNKSVLGISLQPIQKVSQMIRQQNDEQKKEQKQQE